MLSRKDLLILLASSRKRNRNLAQQVRYYKKKCEKVQRLSREMRLALLRQAYSVINEILLILQNQYKDHPELWVPIEIILEKHLCGGDSPTTLEDVVNRAFDRVLERMEQDVSYLTPKDKALFCCMVVQLGSEAIRILKKANCTATVGTQKSRLKRKLGHYTVKGRKEYLALIDKKNK